MLGSLMLMMYQMQHTNLKINNMQCVICKSTISGYSNNAQPVAEGRCCEKCNHTVVIPKRIDKVIKIYKQAEIDGTIPKSTDP